jgi:sulfur-oxidizing protein SoxX
MSVRSGTATIVLLAALSPGPTSAQGLLDPLTETPGDPVRGAAIVTNPDHGLCTLCHSGPFPQVAFAGTLGPDLTGVGARHSIATLRQQIVDSRIANPDTIMPPYFSTDGLFRVGATWQGTTMLTAQEVEDVVAYLATLTGDTP